MVASTAVNVEGFRLSPQQRRLWTLWRESSAYRAQCAVLLEGAVDEDLLHHAVQDVVDRHDVLRTTFRRERGLKVPLQVVATQGSAEWRRVVLEARDGAERERALRTLLQEEAEAPVDLETGPVLQVCLAALDCDLRYLVLTLPALAADGRSLVNLVAEVAAAYETRRRGGPPEGADELVQYPQFSEWQTDLLEDDEAADGRDFWEKVGAGLPEPLRLAPETPPDGEPSRLQAEPIDLDGVAARLEPVAGELGAAPETVLLAAWHALLSRVSGRPDLAVATFLENRHHEDLQAVLGPLAKSVPIHCRMEPTDDFAGLVRRTRDSVLEASDWVEFYAPDPETGPGCDIGFEAHRWIDPAATEGLRVSLFGLSHHGETTKLLLSCIGADGRWIATLRFDPRRVPAAEAERLARRFEVLLAGALEGPDTAVDRLPVLGRDERRLLLAKLNDTRAPFPRDRCLHELIAEQAAQAPDREALRYGDRWISYADLETRANRLAHHLRALGVESHDRVALCLERSPGMVIAVLGILKAGATYVAIDPSYPTERVALLLEDSRPRLVVTDRRLAAVLPAASTPRVLLDGDAERIASCPATDPGASSGPHDLAYVLYTSGSTGRPKGVMVPHRGLVNYLAWAAETYEAAEGGAALHSSIGFDLTVTSLFAPLLAGGSVVVLPEEEGTDPLGAAMSAGSTFSLVKVTPAHLEILRHSLRSGGAAGGTHALVLGGEALFWESLASWRAGAPDTRLINEYGPTETVVGCCVYEAPADSPAAGPVPIGRPIANARLYLLDGYLEPAPFGAPGEIAVGGVGVTRGYLGRPGPTAERFLPDPFGPEPGGRLYRTGDVGRHLATGDLEFLGRNDHQVKVRGHRVEPGEVEGALRSHPGISEAVVVPRETAGGQRDLVAYTVGEDGVGAAELRAHLRGLLPSYMVPAHFVELAEMPVTRHGKIDRGRLPEPESARAVHVPPRNPREGKLVALWEEVLQRQDVGVRDRFFDLGGDSIKAVRLVGRINDEVAGANLQMQDVFEHQTIETLAPAIDRSGTRPSLRDELATGGAQIEELRRRILGDEEQHAELPADVEDLLPLSGIEKGMLYHSLLTPDQPVYHDQALYLVSLADPERFFHAFELMIRKHSVFRSVFHFYTFDEPVKVVVPRVPVGDREIEDLSGLSRDEQIRHLERYRDEDLARPFELDGHALWRLKLFRLDGDLHCVVWTWHHAVLDGWSNLSFWVEVNELYTRPDLDELEELPPLQASYRDYLAISLARVTSPRTEAFWRQTLDGFVRNRLPFHRIRPVAPNAYGMSARDRSMSRDLLAKLRSHALKHHVSIQAVFLAAHVELLRILTGESDVVTGVVSHDRPPIPDGDRVLGCFLNTVPVRMDTRLTPTGMERIEAVNRYLVTVKEHEIPLVDVAGLVGAQAEGDNPIFDTIFNFMDFHVVEGVRENVLFAPLESAELGRDFRLRGNEMTNTLLDVEVSVTRGTFFVRIKFSPRFFEPDEIDRAVDLYERILERIGADPEARLGAEALLAASERDEIVHRINRTAVEYPRHLPMHRLFEERAASAPTAVALVCAGRSLTYGQLDRRADRLAGRLSDLGAGRGTKVAVAFERSGDLVAALLAVLKTGAAYVPLEPDYPAARKGYIVAKSGARLLLADRAYDVRVPEPAEAPELVLWTSGDADSEETGPPEPTLDPADLAYTIYTSGSTGNPKGVMIAHHSAVNLIQWVNREYAVGPETRILMLSSVCFDLSVWDLFGGLGAGATVVVARPGDLHDPARLLQLVTKERITFWNSVPSTLSLLVRYLEDVAPDYRQESLQVVFLSGDWIPVSLPSRVRRFFPNARVISLGGATEGTVWSIYFPVAEVDPSWASIPYGRPLDNNAFYVLDRTLGVVPSGVTGELLIGGVGVAVGYAGEPAKTAVQFVPDRFSDLPGGRMYRTGDLGRLRPDGYIEFLGRVDHQVKIRGFRVELGEVESQLTRHGAIREAVVVDRVDRSGEKYLCAYFVSSDEDLSAPDLKGFLAETLPEYMIPATFVRLDALPLTANGKIDRKGLPEPDVERLSTGARFTPPADEVETALVEIVEGVLGIEGVGTRHDFFDIGGHSLSAVQVMTRVRRRFDLEVPLRDFFDAPTVQSLARVVHRLRDERPAQSESPSGIVPGRRPETPPASFNQERLWFLQQLEPDSPAFNLPQVVRLQGRLHAPVVGRVLAAIEARHESLRTTFREVDGAPVQVIGPLRRMELPVVDLSGVPGSLRAVEVDRLGEEESHRPFDLRHGPLWRARLLRLSAEDHVLLFNIHHIVGDGWSIGIMLRELGALYPAFLRGDPSPLPPLPFQFADYSHWERDSMRGETLEEHLAYWRRQLAGLDPELTLPGQKPRPATPQFRGEVRGFAIPLPLTVQLRELSRRDDVTLFTTMLAAFQALLHLYSGRDDVVVGINFANRSEPELENLIGFFVNNLALRTDVSGDPSFRELMRRVRETALGAYTHQAVPFEKVIEELHPRRSSGYSPLFRVMFTFDNFPMPPLELEELSLEALPIESKRANFDLNMMMMDSPQGLVGSFVYDTDLYDAHAIAGFDDDFKLLLERVVEDPDRPLSEISLVAPGGSEEMLAAFTEEL